MEEIWRNISGYDGLYEVSNLGRVRSLNYNKTGMVKVLRLTKGKEDYLQITLRKKIHMVAKLVWEAFSGPVPEGMQINHINEDKSDNRLVNLNLLNPKDNCNWGTRNDRIREKKLNKKCFHNAPKPVLQYDLNGSLLNEYQSVRDAERQTEYSFSAIRNCAEGCTTVCYNIKGDGCIFKYKKEQA